jgi:hypothetical protein
MGGQSAPRICSEFEQIRVAEMAVMAAIVALFRCQWQRHNVGNTL